MDHCLNSGINKRLVVLGLAVKICLVTFLICTAILVRLTETSSVRALECVPRPSAAHGILVTLRHDRLCLDIWTATAIRQRYADF